MSRGVFVLIPIQIGDKFVQSNHRSHKGTQTLSLGNQNNNLYQLINQELHIKVDDKYSIFEGKDRHQADPISEPTTRTSVIRFRCMLAGRELGEEVK